MFLEETSGTPVGKHWFRHTHACVLNYFGYWLEKVIVGFDKHH